MKNHPLIYRRILILLFVLLLPTLCLSKAAPCGGAGFKSLVQSETEKNLTFLSPDGDPLTVKKHPERVVILLTSLLDVWYDAGGKAIGRCSGKINVPEEAAGLPTAGTFANPNMEKILSLEPDLVIFGDTGKVRAMIPILTGAGIEYAFFKYDHYYDFISIFDVFSRIIGNTNLFEKKRKAIEKQFNDIIHKCPVDRKPNVVIVFSSPNSVITETNDTHTGVLLSMLPSNNIVGNHGSPGKTRVNFSMERIVAADPDVILFNTMGDVEECKNRMEKDIMSNSAWATLSAVTNGNVYYLPKELFLYKSADKFPKALAYLAKILYPNMFY